MSGSKPHPGRQDSPAADAGGAARRQGEAEAQRRESVMPLLWTILGAIAVLIFLAVLWMHSGRTARPATGPAPSPAPPGAPKAP